MGCQELTMRHKRSIPNRGFRVADQIQRDLAGLIRDLKDPRIGMLTVQAVEVTPDYAHAKVFFSVLVGDVKETEIALNEAAGFLRNGLFKLLQIHTVPTLHFEFDRTIERAAELSALIREANSTRALDDLPVPPVEGAADAVVDGAADLAADAAEVPPAASKD
jgi:ribosome-binding factor A